VTGGGSGGPEKRPIFVDANADVRLDRRLRRDMAERGRSPERGGHNRIGVDLGVATVRGMLERARLQTDTP
jgi:hypothetical protein